jgi:Flp pilus assembly protein TadG
VSVRRDDGQSALTVLFVGAALFVAVLTAMVSFGGYLTDRTRAQSAADAAALGGVTGGVDVATGLAERHGATLVSYVDDGDRVTVIVRVDDSTATASASDAP